MKFFQTPSKKVFGKITHQTWWEKKQEQIDDKFFDFEMKYIMPIMNDKNPSILRQIVGSLFGF